MASNIEKKINLNVLILLLSVSAGLAYGYFNRVDMPNFGPRLELHNQIIAGTAQSPYRYRVLVPFVTELLTKELSVFFPIKRAFLLSYVLYDWFALFFLLTTLLLWLRSWFNKEQALVGVLFIASTMPIALQDHYFQPWSLLEAGLFSAALLAIHKKRYWLLTFLVLLASFNRETALFIPFALLLTIRIKNILKIKSFIYWKPLFLFCGLLILWGLVFSGLRYFRKSAPHVDTIAGLWARNTTTDSLFFTFVNGSLFLGGLWLFAMVGFRRAPYFLKRMVIIVPFYLITIMVWGVWYEVRLLMPLYSLLVPFGLFCFYPPQRSQSKIVA